MTQLLYFIGYTAVALLLLTWGGNLFCRGAFFLLDLPREISPDPANPVRAGRLIGSLERLVTAIGLAAGSWEVIAAVIALKTVARFKELDTKQFAEYFLIGSLASLLWAAVMTGAWIAYDELLGVKGRDRLVTIITPPEAKQNEEKQQNYATGQNTAAQRAEPKLSTPPRRPRPVAPN